MTKHMDQILSHKVFKCLMFVISLITICPIFYDQFSGYMKYGLGFGLIVCAWIMFCNLKELLKFDLVNFLLLLFCASYIVTIFLNRDYLEANIKQLVYMVVFFFIFFISNMVRERKDIEDEFDFIAGFISLVTSITTIVSLYLYLINYQNTFTVVEGEEYGCAVNALYIIGFYQGRLYGLFNPNAMAMINLVSIICSFYCFYREKSDKSNFSIAKKIFFVFNLIIQYVCLLLTNTRGVLYGSLLVVAITFFIWCMKRNDDKVKIRKVMTSLLFASVLCIVIVVISLATKNVVSYLPSIVSNISPINSQISLNVQTLDVDLEQTNITREEGFEFSSGRLKIWEAALYVFKDAPIFGFSREGFVKPVYDRFVEIIYYSGAAIIRSGLHNIYLTVLLSSGIVGFLILAIAVIAIFYKVFYVFINDKTLDVRLLVAFMISISFFIVEMVESRILYQANVFNILFWIFFGYLYYFANERYQKLKKSGKQRRVLA